MKSQRLLLSLILLAMGLGIVYGSVVSLAVSPSPGVYEAVSAYPDNVITGLDEYTLVVNPHVDSRLYVRGSSSPGTMRIYITYVEDVGALKVYSSGWFSDITWNSQPEVGDLLATVTPKYGWNEVHVEGSEGYMLTIDEGYLTIGYVEVP